MADFELIEQRNISGTGILRVPVDKVKNRMSILYLSVLRDPTNRYVNNNWNPVRGKYAFITYLRNNYVIAYADMEFERQSFDSVADIAGQNLIALKCAYEGILISLVRLINEGDLTPLQPYPGIIDAYENLNLMWDEIRVKCYADTAIQASLYRLQYDTCSPDKDDQRKPPPPPPPPSKVPPGTPLNNISPPYDRFNNDNNLTNPFPGDKPPNSPVACDDVWIYVRHDRLLNGSTDVRTQRYAAKAPVDNVYIAEVESGGSSLFAIDRRGPSNTCAANPVNRRIDRGVGTWSNLSWYVEKV